jgi:hypothetical protein
MRASSEVVAEAPAVHDKANRTFTIKAKTVLEAQSGNFGLQGQAGPGRIPRVPGQHRSSDGIRPEPGETLRSHPKKNGHKLSYPTHPGLRIS